MKRKRKRQRKEPSKWKENLDYCNKSGGSSKRSISKRSGKIATKKKREKSSVEDDDVDDHECVKIFIYYYGLALLT